MADGQKKSSLSRARMACGRRRFLGMAGAGLLLPPLESLRGTLSIAAAPDAPRPKRFVFLGFGWGVCEETWYPQAAAAAGKCPLPEGLAPLARHRQDFSVIEGCTHRSVSAGHAGSTFWLTGADQYAVPGKAFSNTISADQVAAARIGSETRFASLQLGGKDPENDGHGPGLSMAWDARGKPLAGLNSPVDFYSRLFAGDDVPEAELRRRLTRQQSVLDIVLRDARAAKQSLSHTDVDKLDEYFESIRTIERRLAKQSEWIGVPRPEAPSRKPKEGLNGRDEIMAMYDLIVAALQTDSTRVITYRQPVNSLLSSIGVKLPGHDLSHYAPNTDRMEAARLRDKTQSELLAGLIDRLKAAKEPDGSSLFDHTVLVYGSNIRVHHQLDNCPTIVGGGGAGITLGQHLVLPKGTPLCNVWLTLLRGAGIELETFGDSSGVVKELQA
jgi:hypothetical protein